MRGCFLNLTTNSARGVGWSEAEAHAVRWNDLLTAFLFVNIIFFYLALYYKGIIDIFYIDNRTT